MEAKGTKEAAKKAAPMTYEELKKIAGQLQSQLVQQREEYQRVVSEYNKAMEMVMGKRLDALFQVLKYKELFDPNFVDTIVTNITEMLSPTENTESIEEDK